MRNEEMWIPAKTAPRADYEDHRVLRRTIANVMAFAARIDGLLLIDHMTESALRRPAVCR